MRAVAISGTALAALILGAGIVVLGQGSTVMPVILLSALVGFAALLLQPRILSLMLFGFAALLPVEILKGLALDSTGVIVLSASPADLLFAMLLPVWLVDRWRAGRDLGWGSAHTAFGLFFAWLAISVGFSRSPDSSAIIAVVHLKYFLFFLVIADVCRDPVHLRAVLHGAAAGLALQLTMVGAELFGGRRLEIEGAKQASIGRQLVFGEAGGLRALRPSGLMNHPNSLAALLVLVLPIMVSVLAFARSRLSGVQALGVTLLAAVSAISLFATLSRGGWLALAVGAAFVGVVATVKGMLRARQAVAILGMVAVVSAGAALLYPPIYLRLIDRDHGAASARALLNDQAVMMISADPILGVGAGAYVKAAKTTIPPSFSTAPGLLRRELLKGFVHNKYLLVAAETGFVGLALFLLVLWRWTAVALQAASMRSGWEKALALGTAGGIVAQSVTYFFEHAAYDVRIGLIATAAAIAAALAGPVSPAGRR